ncbi:DUF2610 domain-containing protein [Wolbachia endosymbiont of Pentidionis agamae]|uniref:DUF2610 domain-containing protein n=1 Tax=Wolbachia endosymbiont of Pentidionis agamae TaxID=3110435 RepID=UPI002FD01CB0
MSSSVKKFTVNCDFKGQSLPFVIYIGEPKIDMHPIYHQDSWLSKERGGNIPTKIRKSLDQLYKLSKENNVSFPDLCAYAITVVSSSNSGNDSNE